MNIVDYIWDHSRKKSNELLVLLVLARHVDSNNEVAMTCNGIARKTGYSTRQVKRIINSLLESGTVEIISRATPRRFKLTIGQECSKHRGEKVIYRKIQELSDELGIDIFYDGSFLISPFDVDRVDDIEYLKAFLSKRLRAYQALEVFHHLNYRYNEQFMTEDDLISIIRYCDEKSRYMATRELNRISNDIELDKRKNKAYATAKDDDKRGFVYILFGNGYYKIGKAKEIDRRVSQISPQLPFEVKLIGFIETDDALALESFYHEKYKDKRVNGEWFMLSDEDVISILGENK